MRRNLPAAVAGRAVDPREAVRILWSAPTDVTPVDGRIACVPGRANPVTGLPVADIGLDPEKDDVPGRAVFGFAMEVPGLVTRNKKMEN